MTHVTYSVHRLLLDSSRRDLFNGTNGVIIGVLICLKDFSISFFLYLFFSLSSFLLVICEEGG